MFGPEICLGLGNRILFNKQTLEVNQGIDKTLVQLVQVLVRAPLHLRDRGMEVLGIPLMQHLVIAVPLERPLCLRTVTTNRGPDGTSADQ